MKQLMLLLIATYTASCSHIYYTPNTANIPLLSKKGETLINALSSEGSLSTFTGGEFQIATAVSDKFSIMMNTMFIKGEENTGGEGESGNGSYAEFAGGFYKSLDKKKKCIVEIYTGTGFGTVNNYYGYGQASKVGIMKFFLQPAIGFKSKYFEMAFTPKISFIHWKVKEDNLPGDPNYYNYDKRDLFIIRENPHFISLEPALIIRGGFPNIKFHLGYSYSHPARQFADLTEELIGSGGISVNFNWRKKQKEPLN